MFGRFMRLDPRPGPRVLHRVYATERFNRKTVTEKAGKAHVAARAAGSPPRRPRAARAGPRTARSPARIAPRHAAFAEYFAVLVSLYLAILLVRAASRPTGTGSGRPGRAGARRKNRSVLGTGASTFFASHDGRYCTRAPALTRTRAPCARAETPRGARGRDPRTGCSGRFFLNLIVCGGARRGLRVRSLAAPVGRNATVATSGDSGGRALRLRPRMCYDLCRARASRREKRDAVRSDP